MNIAGIGRFLHRSNQGVAHTAQWGMRMLAGQYGENRNAAPRLKSSGIEQRPLMTTAMTDRQIGLPL